MKFEELYKKYQNGTATREERAYVEEELRRAQEVAETVNPAPQIAAPVETEVAQIKKTFRLKTLIASLLIAVVSIVLIVGVVLGIVFGISVPAAKDNVDPTITAERALELAKAELVKDSAQFGNFVRLDEVDLDLDFEIESPLKDSYYKWEIEIETDKFYEVTYHVSTKDGRVILAHVDR